MLLKESIGINIHFKTYLLAANLLIVFNTSRIIIPKTAAEPEKMNFAFSSFQNPNFQSITYRLNPMKTTNKAKNIL